MFVFNSNNFFIDLKFVIIYSNCLIVKMLDCKFLESKYHKCPIHLQHLLNDLMKVNNEAKIFSIKDRQLHKEKLQ